MFSDAEIAGMAYEVSRAYNHVIGDPWLDPPWPSLPPWYTDAVINGVHTARHVIPVTVPTEEAARRMHENWRAYYERLGWVHGEAKDTTISPPTHPCLVPFADVPPGQQFKSILFREFVLMAARLGVQYRAFPGRLTTPGGVISCLTPYDPDGGTE